MKIQRVSYPVRAVELMLLVVLVLSMTEMNAHAYIDPGTGSVFLQLLAGLFFAGIITIKRWAWIVTSLFKGKGKSEVEEKHDK